jgi:fatty-acyl-CoA synthase
MTTIGGWLERWATADDSADRTFLLDHDGGWSWRETWERAALYGNLLRSMRAREDLPLHVGILSENRPEFVFALFGCALAGGVVVGLNPTRRGDAMVRDIEHTDCQILLARNHLHLGVERRSQGDPQ